MDYYYNCGHKRSEAFNLGIAEVKKPTLGLVQHCDAKPYYE
jgi:hypothetical protein